MRGAATLDAPEGPRAYVLNGRSFAKYRHIQARRQGGARSVVLAPIKPRLSTETALRRIIVTVLREIEARRVDMLAAARQHRSELFQDRVDLGSVLQTIRNLVGPLVEAARYMLRRLFRVESVRHGKKWIEQVNSAIGVDLSVIVSQADIEPLIELAVQKNVALITGLTADVQKRVEIALIDMITAGKSNAQMAEALDEAFRFGRKRAELIARDQAAKFNGNLNRIQHQRIGVTKYVWWTMQDERVRGNPDGKYPRARPSHWDRHGKTFRYADAPSDGNPGEPINCRCIARPVLKVP